VTEILGGTAFFDRTYDEAIALLHEARNYIAFQEPRDVQDLDADARLLVSQETLRITCRMTQVMAWLFGQRAVHRGEITRAEALHPDYAVGGQAVCLDDAHADDPRLPPAVADLLDRSHRLYERVVRLDRQIRETAA